MRTFAEVEKLLTELSIPYKIVEHPALQEVSPC